MIQQFHNTIPCDELDEAIDHYTNHLGYRLDMIAPADAPTTAVLSKSDETIRLEISSEFRVRSSELRKESESNNGTSNSELGTRNLELGTWMTGRAGMEYRNLIAGRLGGKVIASHIRLTKAGQVADYVHYHKVEFQMIYCKRGRIRVVYEDQGVPFWLETGDCVLQPPEIRHRVLESTAGAEVIEVSMPAEHETWVEHEITLPTSRSLPERIFNGQKFVRHVASEAEWTQSKFDGFIERDTGIKTATGGFADVRVLRAASKFKLPAKDGKDNEFNFCFALGEDELLSVRVTL